MILPQMRLFLTTSLLILSLCHVETKSVDDRKNVLFITVDDLRPELGAFIEDRGRPHPGIHTPNIDGLASRSLLLKKAFVQQPMCSPSRTSFLTGRRPDTTHVWYHDAYFRLVGGNFTTIPQYFKENGYTSLGMGKIFHPGMITSGNDDPPSWSEPYYQPPCPWDSYELSWRAVTEEDVQDCPLPDTAIVDRAIQNLHRFVEGGDLENENFFLAVGLNKPHLPFIFPEEFLDLYPRETIHMPENPYAPVNMPQVGWYTAGEFRDYHDVIQLNYTGAMNETLPDEKTIDLRRAYYASVSHADAEIGRLLDELKTLGLEDSTIVTFLGDHGWKLGDHGTWGKMCDLELSPHAPMMMSIPGLTDQGIVTEELTEFVDLYPSLLQAANLPPVPLCPEDSSNIRACTEGSSFLHLITGSSPAKDRVFSQMLRNKELVEEGVDAMGYSMRTHQFRYTEWPTFDRETYQADWSNILGVELYDHEVDPQENHNVADDPYYSVVREELSAQLREGWRAALPISKDKTRVN